MNYTFAHLTPADVDTMKDLLRVFGDAFEDVEHYQGAVPSDAYLQSLLAMPHFIVLVARHGDEVVGGLAAYELAKFERERREIYIYDLAVARRIAGRASPGRLIGELKGIARTRRAYVIYVQADRGDDPAIALYESCGTREDVHHFDISGERLRLCRHALFAALLILGSPHADLIAAATRRPAHQGHDRRRRRPRQARAAARAPHQREPVDCRAAAGGHVAGRHR